MRKKPKAVTVFFRPILGRLRGTPGILSEFSPATSTEVTGLFGEDAGITGCSRPLLGSRPAGCFERQSVTVESTDKVQSETEPDAPQSMENGIIRS